MTGGWSREWRLFFGARANAALLLVLFVLAALGAWNGIQRLAASDRAVAEAVAADHESYAGKRAKLTDFEAGRIEAGAAAGVRFAHKSILGAAQARALAPPRAELGALSAAERRPAPDLLQLGVQTRHKDQAPTLDPRASYEFSELLKRLSSQGVAILMATHDIFRALDVATRVGIMQGGVLGDERSTREIAAEELEALYLERTRIA